MLQRVLATVAVSLLPILCLAADGITVTTNEDGSVTARDSRKGFLWHRFNPAAGDGSAEQQQALLAPRSAASATQPTWDPLTTLDADKSSDLIGPVFDSLGNAWVVVSDSVNLMAIQSNGTSGTWKTPHVIAAARIDYPSVGIAVDRAGGVYVVYLGTYPEGGPYPLMWTKYTPAAGWSAPMLAYSSPQGWGNINPVLDSTGRLVITFDANGVTSVVCNPTTLSCGGAQIVEPDSSDPLLPTAAGNQSGSRLVLTYLLYKRGLRYSFFNSSTGQWDPPATVPNSQGATFVSYGSRSYFPLAVDESGNVTLVTALRLAPGIFNAGGFRYENGVWTMTRLARSSRTTPPFEAGSIAVNNAGEVLAAVPANAGYPNPGSTAIDVYRFRPGVGWKAEVAGFYESSTVNKCTVAWFLSGEAVVVYAGGPVGTSKTEQSSIYSNGAWAPGPPIPGPWFTTYPSAATAPTTGEVVLGLEPNLLGDGGTVATWLRP